MNSLGIGMTSARTRERLIKRLQEQGITDNVVLDRIREVPRHLFVDEALASRAYEDTALPIGLGQTISQPYIVARMTEAIRETGRLDRVLEIGTGCGYQTAVLAPLAGQIYTIERVAPLIKKARNILFDIGIKNIRYLHGDGMLGWPQYAPYDAILGAAAPEEIPPALLSQLANGGRLVLPVGPTVHQKLIRVTRKGDKFQSENLGKVRFVPMLAGVGSWDI